DRDDHRGRQRGKEARREQKAAARLYQPSQHGLEAPRPESELFHQWRGAGDAATTKPAKELLNGVSYHDHADDQAQDEKSDSHVNLRSVTPCCEAVLLYINGASNYLFALN